MRSDPRSVAVEASPARREPERPYQCGQPWEPKPGRAIPPGLRPAAPTGPGWHIQKGQTNKTSSRNLVCGKGWCVRGCASVAKGEQAVPRPLGTLGCCFAIE